MSRSPILPVLAFTALSALACGPLADMGVPVPGGSSSSGGGDDDDGGEPPPKVEAGQVVQTKPATGIGALIAAGTDSSVPPPAPALTSKQCGDITDGGPVKMQGCITDVIECGQTIYGHTSGGVKLFNTRWYERNFCTPGTTNHDSGDERIYLFRFPDDGKWRAWFTLDTPCADLDVAAIQWDGTGCPSADANVNECDMNRKQGTIRERAEAISDGNWVQWLVVVEGVGNEDGPFALSVQCREGLQ